MPRLIAFTAALLVSSGPGPTAYAAPQSRSVAAVARAIAVSRPSMPKAERLVYAKSLVATATKYDFDPLTGVAIIHHESGWRPNAVSRDGEDLGLAQIRARFELDCRNDSDPVHAPSPACAQAKLRLFDGTYNIRRMGAAIHAWRQLCRSKRQGTGRPALLHRWLAGYGGMHRPQLGIRCGQKKVRGRWQDLPLRKELRRIIQHRQLLIRRLSKR